MCVYDASWCTGIQPRLYSSYMLSVPGINSGSLMTLTRIKLLKNDETAKLWVWMLKWTNIEFDLKMLQNLIYTFKINLKGTNFLLYFSVWVRFIWLYILQHVLNLPGLRYAERVEMLISCRCSSVSVWKSRSEKPSENAIHTPPPARTMCVTLTTGSGWASKLWQPQATRVWGWRCENKQKA